MIKRIVITLILNLLFYCAFADIRTLAIDVENYQKFGYRPLSLGSDYYLNTQGAIKEVDYKYAFCIYGKGFFSLLDNNQQVIYTRDVFFHTNEEGVLVNKDEYPVLGINSNISEKKFEFISADNVLDKNSFKRKGIQRLGAETNNQVDYFFLIVSPQKIKNLSGDYLYADDYLCIDSYVIQYAREIFPMSYEQLLDLCINEFSVEKDCIAKKKEIYQLLEYQKDIIFNQNIINPNDKNRILKKLDCLIKIL
nr:hypothetical protein [uncultured Treponema sp.]